MTSRNSFIDEVMLTAIAGDGGDGIVSFRREKFVPRGGPNGGDGGRGGDVVMVADRNLATLWDQKYRPRVKAGDGASGGGNDRTGADGDDSLVRVPVGTAVYDLDASAEGARSEAKPSEVHEASAASAVSQRRAGRAARRSRAEIEEVGARSEAKLSEVDQASAEGTLFADLVADGQRVVVVRGGRGGLGNTRFKKPTRQTPDFATPGRPGERRRLRLSLKLLADVGLVGAPNAGKSTLLRRVSAARPRVADYPFTTLVPALGVAALDDRRFVVADIPGLIEGASQGVGLGDRFLRHIERTRVLVHLLDVGTPVQEDRDLLAEYDAIRRELLAYDEALLERVEIVALNKIDLVADREILGEPEAALRARGREVVRISGATGEGIGELLRSILRAIDAEATENDG
jgi:GTP-binding protein